MVDGLIDLAWLVYFIDTLATEDYNEVFGVVLFVSFIGYLLYMVVPSREWAE